MKLALVQIYPWDRPSLCELGELTLEIGQRLLVETDSGQELGRVLGFKYLSDDQAAAWSGHTKTIAALASQKRQVVRLDNPIMPPGTPLPDTSWWWR